MATIDYPHEELDKHGSVHKEIAAIEEFIQFVAQKYDAHLMVYRKQVGSLFDLDNDEFVPGEHVYLGKNIQSLAYEMYGIDAKRLDSERDGALRAVQELN